MNRRPIEYKLVVGGSYAVYQSVAELVANGWWLHGELLRLNDTQVARELVKYEPLSAVTSSGHVVKES